MKKHLLRAGLFLSLAGGAGAASAVSDDTTAYLAAGQKFSQAVSDLAGQHRLPRAADPEYAELLATLSNHRRFLTSQQFAVADLGDVVEICSTALRANMAYVFFDLNTVVDKTMTDPAKITAAVMQVANRNAVTYQEEVTAILSFTQRCAATQIPLLVKFVETLKPEDLTPIRRDGLKQVRSALFGTFANVARTASETAITPQNRRIMFDTMRETTPVFAQALDLATRKNALDIMTSTEKSVPPELRAQYEQITETLRSTNCESLCRL